MMRRFISVALAIASVAWVALPPSLAGASVVCGDFSPPGCGGESGDTACPAGLDCVAVENTCQCQPRLCCKCEPVNPPSGTNCNFPCADQTFQEPFTCLQLCGVQNDPPPNNCAVEVIKGASCTDGACETTGCCDVGVANARTAGVALCAETDAFTCGLINPQATFVPGGVCAGGVEGMCVTPTPTSTPSNTPTVTSTPTNTLVPNGGDCVTPGECASTFCVDGVCCETACEEPNQACNNPANPGICSAIVAPAPAMSASGLLVGLLVLAAVGALALVWRRA